MTDEVERDELSDDDLIEAILHRQRAVGSLTLSREIFVGGVRHSPGRYQLANAGRLARIIEDAF